MSSAAFAKDPPISAEQLRGEFEAAIKARDTNALLALFSWEGVPEDDKEMTVGFYIEPLLKANIASVVLAPLSTNLETMMSGGGNSLFGDNGQRVIFSVDVLGQIDVSIAGEETLQLWYGKKEKSCYMAAPISYQAPGKSLSVRVLGSMPYTGSWVYVQNERETKVDISERTNRFRMGWGDYIKSCTVRRTSTNGPGPGRDFHFEISEGGKIIFKSPQMSNEDPVVYERKQPGEAPLTEAQLGNEIEAQLKARDAEWRNDMARELPVSVSHRMSDDCILVFKSHTNNVLSLIVTAKDESPRRTNTFQFDLAGGATKEIALAGWIITSDDRIRVEIVDPKGDRSFIYIIHDQTPSRQIAKQQEGIFKEFNDTAIQAERSHDAKILSDLWRADLLKDEIKDQLALDHYHVLLRQIVSPNGVPAVVVDCSQTFPFPDVYTAFTPTQYLNDQVSWAPGSPQKSCSMTVTNTLTSMAGGAFKNGDIIQYKIELMQKDTDRGRSWQKSLWSNKIELRGLNN